MSQNQSIAGIENVPVIYKNLSYDEIFEHEKKNQETVLTSQGAMAVDTGIYTGRSPGDKFFVREPSSERELWWGTVNRPVSEDVFDELHSRALKYLSGKPLYVFEGFAGARQETRLSLRIITEKAWQHHFCTNMFIRPTADEIQELEPEFTIINASQLKNADYRRQGLNSDVFVIFHLGRRLAIIGGTEYGGEMKKGIFSVLNFYRPQSGILTMHCSANVGRENGDTALFFGLSGTGKTTLSTDPGRPLIGDDEHGWDDRGIWNIEGGCYAKAINLDPDDEPEIYAAIRRNALLENVVVSPAGIVDYTDSSKTLNTRVSYPIFHIQNRLESGQADHPQNIIFLACDAFGVLPPVSRLSPEQAMYHFLSGYTAKVAGTERGITEPVAAFSACFGAAFMTLHPVRYAALLGEKMKKHGVRAYLVNTGWSGGPYGVGSRMRIRLTRSIINGIFSGALNHGDFSHDPVLNLEFPNHLGELTTSVLHPRESWRYPQDYDRQRNRLAEMFMENFKQYASGPSEFDFSACGPQLPVPGLN